MRLVSFVLASAILMTPPALGGKPLEEQDTDVRLRVCIKDVKEWRETGKVKDIAAHLLQRRKAPEYHALAPLLDRLNLLHLAVRDRQSSPETVCRAALWAAVQEARREVQRFRPLPPSPCLPLVQGGSPNIMGCLFPLTYRQHPFFLVPLIR